MDNDDNNRYQNVLYRQHPRLSSLRHSGDGNSTVRKVRINSNDIMSDPYFKAFFPMPDLGTYLQQVTIVDATVTITVDNYDDYDSKLNGVASMYGHYTFHPIVVPAEIQQYENSVINNHPFSVKANFVNGELSDDFTIYMYTGPNLAIIDQLLFYEGHVETFLHIGFDGITLNFNPFITQLYHSNNIINDYQIDNKYVGADIILSLFPKLSADYDWYSKLEFAIGLCKELSITNVHKY